jgi:hypothetical protein
VPRSVTTPDQQRTTPRSAAPWRVEDARKRAYGAASGERGRSEQSFSGILEIKAPGDDTPAGNEGVGEHVRTKSQPAKAAAETADLWIRTE